jgi:uncharacterized protein YdeI (BOF family)
MRIFKGVISLGLAVAVVISIAGCGQVKQYGRGKFEGQTTNIKSILTSPGDYDGKVVEVEGKITRECPTGCWFDLEDETGTIYVDLNPSNFAIPQKVGNKATVRGKVKVKRGIATLIGEGAKIK